MCRAKGARCEHKWTGTQRNIYNAKRRVVRNGERTAKAEENNNPEKAAYYSSLMMKAQEEVKIYNEQLARERAESYQNALNATNEESSDGSQTLTSVNPTGGIFVDYNPSAHDNLTLGEGMSTFDAMEGIDPDTEITVYRGVPAGVQSELNSGDFITTSKQLAQDYAGNGEVITTKVKAKEIITQEDEHDPDYGEFLYRKSD